MNPVRNRLNRLSRANQDVKAIGENFRTLYSGMRLRLNNLLADAVKNSNDPFAGKSLDGIILGMGRAYSGLEKSFQDEFKKTIPPRVKQELDRAANDMGRKIGILGEHDKGRINIALTDAYTHVAGMTQQMHASDIQFLRSTAGRVFQEASLTGESRKSVSARMLSELTKRPDEFKFVDAKGRVWNNQAYCEMLGRTVLMNEGREAYLNKCAENGDDVVIVSVSGTCCPDCAEWENMPLSISGKDERFHSLQEAIDGGLFHPNCTHSLSAAGEFMLEDEYHVGKDGTMEPNEGTNSPGHEAENTPEAWQEYRKYQIEDRRDKSIQEILSSGNDQVKKESASEALKKGFSVIGSDGKSYIFGKNLQGKYEEGTNRLKGSEPDRLKHLGRAVEAMKKTNVSVTELPDTNPPQIRFVHRISEKQAIVVFAERDTGVVRSFIYQNKSINGFLKKYQ